MTIELDVGVRRWLEGLEGDWIFEADGPDGARPVEGMESVRSLDGGWYIADAAELHVRDSPGRSVMALGYDPEAGRLVGTLVRSDAPRLWVLSGTLDGESGVVTLHATAPSRTPDAGRHLQTLEFSGPDVRVTRRYEERPDGERREVGTTRYRRTSW